jgi:tetratricopeptide (TPR) repeat protein
VEADPAAAGVVHNLAGGLFLAKGDTAAAAESFRAAIGKNPNLLAPYYALAGIYLREKKAEKAIEQFAQLLAVNPKQAGAHMMMAVIYDTQRRPDLSEKHYRACLEIDPKFAPAANNLAYLLAEGDRDLNEALKYAQKARGLLPEEPSVMDTLGWVYYKKGLYDSAIGEFKASLAKAAGNPTVMYHLGLAYHRKGESDKARVELNRALELSGSFEGAEQARALLAQMK